MGEFMFPSSLERAQGPPIICQPVWSPRSRLSISPRSASTERQGLHSLYLHTPRAKRSAWSTADIAWGAGYHLAQSDRDDALLVSIKHELHELKLSIASDVMASKDQLVAEINHIFVRGCESKLEEILRSCSSERFSQQSEDMGTFKTTATPAAVQQRKALGRSKEKAETKVDEVLLRQEEIGETVLERFNLESVDSTRGAARHVNESWIHNRMMKEVNRKGMLARMGIHIRIPESIYARITHLSGFQVFTTLAILANTVFMGYEADLKMKMAMTGPPGDIPGWLSIVRMSFTVFFCMELLFRMAALRSFFFIEEGEWAWNVFDLFLVTLSVATEVVSGFNFSFVRIVRVLRIVRITRMIRVFRAFRSLRHMFLAILACLPSVGWAFAFTSSWMFMFSIFFLQGAYEHLYSLDTELERDALRSELNQFYGTLDKTMLSLTGAVTGGLDWFELRKPLSALGHLYTGALAVYVLVVTIGFLNILVGIFASHADSVLDRDLTVNEENAKLDHFVSEMVNLFKEFDVDHSGTITWRDFQKYISNESVQAYFASHELDSTHAYLLFHLLDQDGSGTIDIREFTMGLMKLKGTAKSLDARIIQRDLTIVKRHLEIIKSTLL